VSRTRHPFLLNRQDRDAGSHTSTASIAELSARAFLLVQFEHNQPIMFVAEQPNRTAGWQGTEANQGRRSLVAADGKELAPMGSIT
jgi:hypothetical protein